MKLRIKQVRAGGTEIVMGKGRDARKYNFAPLDPNKPGEDHVCDVTHQADLAAMLAIPDGFEIHASQIGKEAAAPSKGAGKPDGNPAGDGEGGTQADGGAGAEDLTKLDKAELLKRVEAKTGKKPHPATSTAKLIEALQAE